MQIAKVEDGDRFIHRLFLSNLFGRWSSPVALQCGFERRFGSIHNFSINREGNDFTD